MKKRKFPHTYVIIFTIILISAVLTWVLPGGEYATASGDGVSLSAAPEYRQVDNIPQTWHVFAALYKGFVRQSGIIVFILMIGGAFWIMNDTKAIDSGIFSFLKLSRRLEKLRVLRFLGVHNIILTLIMLLFSVFGAIFGMSEETIAFIIILVPLAISMGYDSITGVGISFVAAALGFAGAILNPFTIGIAQGLAGLPLFSGLEYRLFCWLIINIAGIGYILRYAAGVRRDPERSPVFIEDDYWRSRSTEGVTDIAKKAGIGSWLVFGSVLAAMVIFSVINPASTLRFGDPDAGSGSAITLPLLPAASVLFLLTGLLTIRSSVQLFILNLLMFTILILIIGVMGYEWYIMEIAALFFAMGILAGMAFGNGPNRITRLFIDGAADIMPAALVVGLAGGIIVILEDGRVVNTILHAAATSMKDMGDIASVQVMYAIQTGINIIIPSGSAKAALTMPIMAPFSDLIGVSRQATVMAFQFGDGFTNLITPTSGVLIGVLGVARIPYEKWVKWVTPLIIILIILGAVLLIPTVTMELNGF
ncbi:MAG: YfcC family protein [Bacteroidetes bacterium]|nr:YfcC family protein [Bacteroidota bacterium]